MKVTVDYNGLRTLSARFTDMPAEMDRALGETVQQAAEAVYQQAKANIHRMFRTSGRMENALRMTFDRIAGRYRGTVSISGVGYVTQELGGRAPYDIVPVSAQVLHFFAGGRDGLSGGPKLLAPDEVFAKNVRHPMLPERSFLRAALAQKQAEIKAMFEATVGRAQSAR